MAYKTFKGVQDMMRQVENPLIILPKRLNTTALT